MNIGNVAFPITCASTEIEELRKPQHLNFVVVDYKNSSLLDVSDYRTVFAYVQ